MPVSWPEARTNPARVRGSSRWSPIPCRLRTRTRPVNISKSVHPKAQTSLRLSTGSPRACSGLMYAAVPMTAPSRGPALVAIGTSVRSGVTPSPPTALASPKSRTFTTPSGVILMLAGLRSRWTMPLSCATSSASVICRAIANASASGNPARRARRDASFSASVSPSTSSSDQRRMPSTSSTGVDGADAGVIEGGEHACLALEARQAIRIVGECGGKNLDGDVAAELHVARAVYLTHPAGAEERLEAISADDATDAGRRRDCRRRVAHPRCIAGCASKAPSGTCSLSSASTSRRTVSSSAQAAARNAGRSPVGKASTA